MGTHFLNQSITKNGTEENNHINTVKLRTFLKLLPFSGVAVANPVVYGGMTIKQIDALIPKSRPEHFSLVFCLDNLNTNPMSELSGVLGRIMENGYQPKSFSTDSIMRDDQGGEFHNYRKNKIQVYFSKTT